MDINYLEIAKALSRAQAEQYDAHARLLSVLDRCDRCGTEYRRDQLLHAGRRLMCVGCRDEWINDMLKDAK